jgi:hypothetical protein
MEGKATSKLVEIDTRTSCLELALDQFPVDVTNCIPRETACYYRLLLEVPSSHSLLLRSIEWMTFKDEHMILCSSGNYCLLGKRIPRF